MHLNSTQYHMYAYDGHGHSTGSDGFHEPERIIDIGISKNLQIIGLSDHNIVSKLPRFLDYADKINKTKTQFLPIPGIEISTTKGHLLIIFPIRTKAEQFINNFTKPTSKPHPLDFIEEYIRRYDAIAIFVHPNMIMHGITTEYIEKILNKIPRELHKNIGIEVYNWMSQAIFWARAKEEHHVHIKNHILGLATFSFTDYHSAYHIGNGSTAMYMEKLTGEDFLRCVQARRTAPLNISNRGIGEYIEIVKATLAAEALSHTGRRSFHISKN